MTIRVRQHITNRWQHNLCCGKAYFVRDIRVCLVWLLMVTVFDEETPEYNGSPLCGGHVANPPCIIPLM
jgi:hypothetical protein